MRLQKPQETFSLLGPYLARAYCIIMSSSSALIFSCEVENCNELATYRCSRCKAVHYCCAEHQKLHWKIHKRNCTSAAEVTPTVVGMVTDSGSQDNGANSGSEKRVCRCMFCGNELVLGSEEEAIDHMGKCPALQEQLASKEQFCIPKDIQSKMKK